MKDRMFSDREFTQKLVRLAMPTALQAFMLAAVAAADAIMLGSLDQNAMSAVSLATQIQFIQNMFLTSATAVIMILGAQYWGKKDARSVSAVFCIGLRFNVLVSAMFFAGCVFFPRILMTAYTNEEILIEIGADYLQIAGWSYLLTGISQCLLALMKVSEHAPQAAGISIGAVLLNILLNAVLIFGWFGLEPMGVRGAALATLIARIAELTVAVGFALRKDSVRPQWKQLFQHEKVLVRDFVRCLLPLLGAGLVWGIGFTSYSSFMGHLGTDAAAANSVAAVVRDLVCCLCDGLASGGGILVGNELGAGLLEKGKLYGVRVAKLGFLCGLVSALLMLISTPILLSFVRLTERAHTLLLGLMLITSFYMIGRALNTVLINGIFAAGGDTLFDMYSLGVTMWGIAVPLAALGTFVLNWSPLAVFACTCLDEVGKIPWVLIHFRKYKWVKNLTREQNAL